jgi:lipid II:glycine glycyltransferase (peptidoglycan interpeptide bridge formation enzyme)
MWQHITGKCRNRIRKGQKSGLRVEQCDDISIVEDYYAQHTDVFDHQGLPPKYPLKTVHALVHNLMSAGMLLAIRIRYKGETVATGLFPHDNRYLYSFGIAAWVKYRHLCPNELLYWSAMQWGGSHGLQRFSIGGKYRQPPSGGVFKEKFNGELIPVLRYAKALSPVLGMAYQAYSILREIRSRSNQPIPIANMGQQSREHIETEKKNPAP